MKNKKTIYIAVLIISALLTYFSESIRRRTPPEEKIAARNAGGESHALATAPSPAPAAPDYAFVLRAVGTVSKTPLYSRYRVAVAAGEKARIEKEIECILDFTPREIIHLTKAGKTVIIGGAGRLLVFDEKERKISAQTPLARFAKGGGKSGGTAGVVCAAAKSMDERIFALADGGKKTVELMAADNFGPLVSIDCSATVAEEITALCFDEKNDLYLTGVDRVKKCTALYISRAAASYSKIEKISWFPLEADSQAENAGASNFVFYNRRSGSVFMINPALAHSGLLFNEIPQAGPPASQLFQCGPYLALIRSDRGKVKIFDPFSGAMTREVEIAGLKGEEAAAADGGVKYAVFSTADGGALWLLNRETLALTGAGKLEGMDAPAVLRVGAQ